MEEKPNPIPDCALQNICPKDILRIAVLFVGKWQNKMRVDH